MKSITFLILLFIFQISLSQDYKLGKVTVGEIEEKQHPLDADAEAAYLFHTCIEKIEYNVSKKDFTKRIEVKAKIKIYKKEGYNWANLEIPYYSESQSRESVSLKDTYTYNLENGKVTKTKLKNESKFDEKINKYWSKMKITFPDVKEGSIIEYEYTIESPRVFKLYEWDFQSSIPVNFSTYQLYSPEYFIYKPHFKGYISPKISTNGRQVKLDFVQRDYDTRATSVIGQNNSYTLEYKENQLIYTLEKIPALREEAFVNNINNYKSSITHELKQFMPPRSNIQNFSTDWETVTKKIYDAEEFGGELKKTGYFDAEIANVLSGKNTRDEKIVAIFEFVKSKVKWNGMIGYYCDEGVRQAYKNKTGNVAEINLMLTAMLRHAGIDANPVLVSTRSNGIAFYPSQTAFNYVIAAVEIENDLILLDATETFSVPNVLPMRTLNWYGRIIRKSGSSAMVNLMPKQFSTTNYNLMGDLSVDSKFTGKIRKVANNHSALLHRLNFTGKDQDSYLEYLENRYSGIDISDYQIENDKNYYSPLTETFSYQIENTADIINDKMFFSPMMFLKYKENPFKSEKREFPVDFSYPFETNYNVMINIPEGYAVESYPEQVKFAMEDMATFTFLVNVTGNRILLKVVETQKTPIVSPEYYEVLKTYYQKMVDKQNEKIVLKRI